MDEEIKDRKKIAKHIAKTSDSIRKKYRALKAGGDIALERHFKAIVEPLQIVKNTVGEKSDVESGEDETFFFKEDEPKPKRKQSNSSFDNSLIPTSTLVKSMLKRSKTMPSNLSVQNFIINYYTDICMLPPSKKFLKSPTNRSCRPFNICFKCPRDKKNCGHYDPLGQNCLGIKR